MAMHYMYKAMVFLMWQCDYSAAGVQKLHFIEHVSGAKYFRDGAILPLLLTMRGRMALRSNGQETSSEQRRVGEAEMASFGKAAAA